MKSKYLVLDFNELTEIGLKKLIAAFEVEGHKVIDFHLGRVTTKDRERIKPFTLYFDNGQSVKVFVNVTGDIVKVMMNSTAIPIQSPRDERDFAKDVSRKLERNQKRFDKSLAQKAQRAIKDSSVKRTAVKTAVQRLNEAKEAESAATESLELMKNEAVEKQNAVLAANNKAASYRTELESEKQLTSQLLDQLNELGVSANV